MLEKAWKLLDRVFLARDDLAVEDDGNPRQVLRRATESVGQVCLGVCGVKADGPLGPGEDNGLRAPLDQVAQGRRRIGHGVRTVGEDEAVVAPIVFPEAPGHLEPVAGADVGAVQVQKLEAVHGANFRNTRDMAQKLLRGQLRGEAPLRHLRGNGASGTDEQNALFPSHMGHRAPP